MSEYKKVYLKEETAKLLNSIKGKMLLKNPKISKLTDDDIIYSALEHYNVGV